MECDVAAHVCVYAELVVCHFDPIVWDILEPLDAVAKTMNRVMT